MGGQPNFSQKNKSSSQFLSQPILLALIVLFGGGTLLWAQALVLIMVGIFLVARPPSSSPSRLIDLGALSLIIAGCLSFLPASWMGQSPWYSIAAKDFFIPVDRTHSPQLLLSLESFILLVAGIGWFYLCCQCRITHQGRKALLYMFIGVSALLALVAIVGNNLGLKYPLTPEAWNFSYFPNRNQTSNYFSLAAIVACCLFIYELKRQVNYGSMLYALVCTSILFGALAYAFSRASIIFFFIGVILWAWLNTEIISRSSFFKVVLPVLLMGIGVLMLSKQVAFERILTILNSPLEGLGDFRLRVYDDALALIKDHWTTGIGLGNFRYIFPFYRDDTYMYGTLIHPESDWLWVFAELGILGVLGLLLGVLAFLRLSTSFQSLVSRPYKTVAYVALLIFIVHSLVDVPGHRYGTVFTAMFLFMLIHPASRNLSAFFPRWLFRVMGLVLIASGCVWFLGIALSKPVHTQLAKRVYRDEFKAAYARQDVPAIFVSIASGIKLLPLDYEWYYQRGMTRLRMNLEPLRAVPDFRIVRFLSPIDGRIVLEEGHAWMDVNFDRAFSAYQESLQRVHFDLNETASRIMNKIRQYPDFKPYMEGLTDNSPPLLGYWLAQLNEDEFIEKINSKLDEGLDILALNRDVRNYLFKRWALSDDVERFLAYSMDHYENEALIPYRAIALSEQASPKVAVEYLLEVLKEEIIPVFESASGKTNGDLRKAYLLNSRDIVNGTELLRRKVASGENEEALKVAEELMLTQQNNLYIAYWEALLRAQANDYRGSWEAFQRYLSLKYGA